MRRIILTCIAVCIMFAPLIIKAEPANDFDISGLPEYTGDINSPECDIVYRSNNIVVVKIDGVYYFFIIK